MLCHRVGEFVKTPVAPWPRAISIAPTCKWNGESKKQWCGRVYEFTGWFFPVQFVHITQHRVCMDTS